MKGRTPLIVNADDYGLTDATSDAILRAHRHGVVTATSVLVLAPGSLSRLPRLDDVPLLSVGVHLALVGEDPPLLEAREIPTLVDRRGRLAASWRHLLPRLAAERIDPDDVRREFGAQLSGVSAACSVAHLDTHQHVHLWPSVAAVVVELARSNGIKRVRVPRPSGRLPRAALMGRMARALDARLQDGDISRTARFRGIEDAGHWSATLMRKALLDLASGSGSVEINVHPGALVDADRARYAWSYRWSDEFEALCDATVRHTVDRCGFVLRASL